LDVVFSSIREEEQRATAETVSRVSEISFTFTGKGRGGQEEEEEDELTGVGGNHEFKNSPVVALGNFSVGVLTVFGREGGEVTSVVLVLTVVAAWKENSQHDKVSWQRMRSENVPRSMNGWT
jgi:hypothetical protein